MVGMIFIRKSIPFSANIFVSTTLNHSITECFISCESIMNALEEQLLALLLQLVSRMVFLVSRLFTISMSVRSSFLDDVFRNWKKVHRIIDELLIRSSFFMQEVPARAIKDADVQYDKHTLHRVLGSVSSNSHSSMFPTSRIICFDSGLKGWKDWLCCRSFWRACRSGWFSIFWISSRTLVLCACFTTECGSPGILKSMSASFTIIGSWFSSWTAMDFSILLRSTSSSILSVSASWHTWESSCAAAVWRVATGRLVLPWVCSTLRLLLSSDERVWISSVSTSRPVLSEELSSSLKELTNIDLLRTGRVCSILHVIKSHRSVTNWIWSWLGWLEEFCLSNNFSFWLSSNFRTQFSCPLVLQGDLWRSRGDMLSFSYKTSPVFSLTTFRIQ